MHEEHLRLRGAVETRTEVVGADGVERRSVRDSERHLETVLGRVPVPRLAYQAPGAPDLHPMDASLNLARELYSHGIRRMVAKEAARASFDEVEELAIRAAQDFDAFYEQRGRPRSQGLVISTDGKGVVMRHEDLREGTRAPPRRAPASARRG